jgi:hypothetical protein
MREAVNGWGAGVRSAQPLGRVYCGMNPAAWAAPPPQYIGEGSPFDTPFDRRACRLALRQAQDERELRGFYPFRLT